MSIELGQKVIVVEGGTRSAGGTPGQVVKVGRVWIDIQTGGRTQRFRKSTQKTGSDIGWGVYFYTLEQWDEHNRQLAALAVLREQGISVASNSPWNGREAELAAVLSASSQTKQEVVSVAVPQLNNGTQTLVVFAVPFAQLQRHAAQHNHRPMTFDEASSVRLGPPTVLTKLDFDA